MLLFLILGFFYSASYSSSTFIGAADDIDIDINNQSFKAGGGSQIMYDDIVIQGNEIRREEDSGIIFASGDIAFQQGAHLITADSIELDIDSRIAKVTNGRTEMNKFFLSAEFLEVKFPEKIVAKNATVTTCSMGAPHFRIEAKEVHFYPDSKFVAYRGWIYIGKHFRLFPIPVYSSYVVPQRDRAPLFPRVTFDKDKGTVVIYGLDYEFIKNETFIGIPNTTIFGLCNLEYSSKRGFGVNRALLKYSFLEKEKIKGSLEIYDWLSARKESTDSSFHELSGYTKSPKKSGSSFNFKTKNEFNIDSGIIFKMSNDKYILGPSKSTLEYAYTNSDIVEDDRGFITTIAREVSHRANVDIKQRVLDYYDIEYKLVGIFTDDSTIDQLIKQEKAIADRDSTSVSSNIDTVVENDFSISTNDKIHAALFRRKRNSNLRPWSSRNNLYAVNNLDLISFTLKPLKLKVVHENIVNDRWSVRASVFSASRELRNYVSSEIIRNDTVISLGSFLIPLLEISHRYEVGLKDEKILKFSNPENTSTYDDGSESALSQARREYRERKSRIVDEEIRKFYFAKAGIDSRAIRIKNFLKLIPRYAFEARKYITDNRPIRVDNFQFDSNIHEFGINAPWMLINNANNNNRWADIYWEIKPDAALKIYLGDTPKDQVAGANKYSWSIENNYSLGNIKTKYKFSDNRLYYAKSGNLKERSFTHKSEIYVGSTKLFDFKLTTKKSLEDGKHPNIVNYPNSHFSQHYATSFYNVRLKFSHDYDDSRIRNRSDRTVIEARDQRKIMEFMVGLYSLEGSYKTTRNYAYNLTEIVLLRDLYENKYRLSFKGDITEDRTISISGSYSNQYDEVSQSFKDSATQFSLSFEDRATLKYLEEDRAPKSPVIKRLIEKTSFFNIEDEEDELTDILALADNEEDDRRRVNELGRRRTPAKIEKSVIKLSTSIKVIHDAQLISYLGGFSWANYKQSWKTLSFNVKLQYGEYFILGYEVIKRRDNILDNFKEDRRTLTVDTMVGPKGYEWRPGFTIKSDVAKNRFEEVYGRIRKSLHCVRIETSFGKKLNRDNKFVWAFGFTFSIDAFPEKSIGLSAREDGVANFNFGL